MVVSAHDKQVLREVAKKYLEVQKTTNYESQSQLFRDLHDLKPKRPMYVFETETIIGFIQENELQCEDPYWRWIEKNLRHMTKHKLIMDDDYIMPPEVPYYYYLDIKNDDYGVGLKYTTNPTTLAVVSNAPIKEVEDLDKLKHKEYAFDKKGNDDLLGLYNEIFGDILPVNIKAPYYMCPGISKLVLDLISMENIYYWALDDEEALHKIVRFITDDVLNYYNFLETNKLLASNTSHEMAGSGSYGYTNQLPINKPHEQVTLKDMWVWIESQETSTISPDMFEEFFLSPMAEIAKKFGAVYYGCCEQLHDRFDRIEKQIHNIKCCSSSPWSDVPKLTEFLNGKYVLSKKPRASYISGNTFDIKGLEGEVKQVLQYCQNGACEFIFRDVYDIGDMKKLTTWGEMMNSHLR